MQNNMELITFEINNYNIGITIPYSLLSHVAKHHPDSPLRVNDPKEFVKQIAYQLEYNLGSEDSGLTGLQQLIDEAIYEVGCSGDECVDIKDKL